MVARAMTMVRIKDTVMMITTTSTMTTKERMATSNSRPNPTCPTLMQLLGAATLWICPCSPAPQSPKEGPAGCLGSTLRNLSLICASHSKQYSRWRLTCPQCLQMEVKVATVQGRTAQVLRRVDLDFPVTLCRSAPATNRHRQMPTQTPCRPTRYR